MQDPQAGADVFGHLASIDRLLAAAFELMKQEPAVDRAVSEQLRQIRVRIRYALSATAPPRSDQPPKVAPASYESRPDKAEGPIPFLARTYSRWLGKNICRADIKKIDLKLYNALYNLPNSNDELDKIGLYTKKKLNDIKLLAANILKRPSRTLRVADMSANEREEARLFNLARRRQQRGAK